MKDIVIKSKHMRKELLIFLICLGIAYTLNVISIIVYKTEWKELYTQLWVVLMLALVIYLLFACARGVIFLLKSIINKVRN